MNRTIKRENTITNPRVISRTQKRRSLFLFLWRRRIRDAESFVFNPASIITKRRRVQWILPAQRFSLHRLFLPYKASSLSTQGGMNPFHFFFIIYCWGRDDLKKLHNWWGQTESPHKGFSILNEAIVYFTLKIDSVNEPTKSKKCFVLRESVHKHRWNTVQICRGFSASFARRLRSSNRHKIIKERWFERMFIEKAKVPKSAGELTWFCLMLRVFAVHSHHSLNSSLYMCMRLTNVMRNIYYMCTSPGRRI